MKQEKAELITSAQNSEIKRLRSLHERKFRRQTGWFLAEGARVCGEAVALGWPMRRLAYLAGRENESTVRPLLDALERDGGRALAVNEKLLGRMSRRDNPQMVVGAFEQRWTDPASVAASGDDVWVALDRVRDPGNLGTIMRTADATGARGIVLVGDCTDAFAVEAVRASMGAVFNVELAQMDESSFLELASAWQGRVIGTALGASVDYRKARYDGPLLIVMGNEQAGLPQSIRQRCDELVALPMLGRSDSLNLAVATGIVLYEVLRSRESRDGR